MLVGHVFFSLSTTPHADVIDVAVYLVMIGKLFCDF